MSFTAPSAVQVQGSHNWIGSNAAYNLLKPTIDPKEAKVWGTQDLTGLMDMLGGTNYIAAISYRHMEEDRIHQVVIAAGTGTGVVGATITYTIDATNYINNFPATPVEPYVATGTQVDLLPVRVNDILLFPNQAQAVVTAVTPGADTFDATLTYGIALPTTTSADNIINLGVSVGEGKDQATPFNPRSFVYYNMAEIMNDKYSTTGTSLGEATWQSYEWKGQTKDVWWFKGQSATFRRFRNFRETKWVVGEKITSATGVNAYDATLTRTEGLIPFASSYNAVVQFNINAGLTLDDYQTIITDSIDKNAGTTEYSVWTSIRNRQAIESFVRAEMKEGGVQYGAFSGGQKQYVDFGFDSFQTLGYTSHLMTYQMFNNPTMLGASGHIYENLSIFVPMNKEIYAIGDTKQKTEVPAIRVNYVKNEKNREWEEWLTGGTGGIYTNENDSIAINFRSHSGFEAFGANRFVTLQGVAA
jgi:hypothetical protein